MIEGRVNEALEPVVEIGLKRGGATAMIPAVVDTGFSGHLCLAEQHIDQLEMAFKLVERYELANGEVIVKDVFWGSVVFDGREQEVDLNSYGLPRYVDRGIALEGLQAQHRLPWAERPDRAGKGMTLRPGASPFS